MVMIPVYMGESRTELTTVRSTHQFREPYAQSWNRQRQKELLKSPPSRTRCARTSCVGGISGRDTTTTDVWWVCLGLVIVIPNDLYTEAWGALGRIERGPLSGCLRGCRSEVLPVMAAHIRVYIKFSPAIWERTSKCFRDAAGLVSICEAKKQRKEIAHVYHPCACSHEWRDCSAG